MDDMFELAFSEAKRAIEFQDSTLSNLRGRASALLSTATLVASLSSGLGLINTDPDKGNVFPLWLALLVVLATICIGTCATYILFPTKNWVFTNNAKQLVELFEQPGADLPWAHKNLALSMRGHEESNRTKLDKRFTAYRIGVAFLVLESLLLVLGFTVE
jgi:hypothetical protein